MTATSSEAGRRPTAVAGDENCQYVTVTVGGQRFGLPIAQVHDVFIVHAITRVPLAPLEIKGLLNLRGRVVTAVCLRTRLGMPDRAEEGEVTAVGLESAGESYGLLVDSVGEVLQLGQDSREPNPVHLNPRWAGLSRGVHRLDDQLLIVLDVDAVLAFGVDARAA
ncbi:chemotaxis protein CheW [Chelatococcus sp. SYSU_G07232]|uniref:Chemotaxis protein CheW n=1 Tax=Chelatococcus albus TaxID=3047466 RepID=A0ABT7AGA6_9HYPH|nr:chemotaxis protein CheW [Chelatococcus sp. SYSU_G07232]MDJ1158140.1 chemotaxis protein CheW [Chelatococcus sp. SYSU_G07232]